MPGRVLERAPAKLNLTLRVLGRGADGLHRLQSLVIPLPWGDRLEVTYAAATSAEAATEVTCLCPGQPALQGPHNLAARAAHRLLGETGGGRCVIHLTKRIPVAAGLGGGSSDAAAALRGLARLQEPAPGAERLQDLAQALGADVPVCLRNRPSWVTGWGEGLAPADGLPAFGLCLLHPPLAVSTRAIFAALDAPPCGPPPPCPPTPRTVDALGALVENDLWPVVRRAHPGLSDGWQALSRQDPVAVGMSGSGPTLFGLFPTEADARSASRRLECQGHHSTALFFEGSPADIGGKKGRSDGVPEFDP